MKKIFFVFLFLVLCFVNILASENVFKEKIITLDLIFTASEKQTIKKNSNLVTIEFEESNNRTVITIAGTNKKIVNNAKTVIIAKVKEKMKIERQGKIYYK